MISNSAYAEPSYPQYIVACRADDIALFYTRGLHVYFKLTLNQMGQYLGISTDLEQDLHMYTPCQQELSSSYADPID